jgi:hypothetical protein
MIGDNARRADDIERWAIEQLSDDERQFVAGFQPTVELALGDGMRLLCFHGSPRSNTEIILAETSHAELEPMFAGVSATLVAGGHTHTPLIRRHRDKLVINPGSVGLPWEGIWEPRDVRNPPWAEYAIVSHQAGRTGVELHRAPVDLARLRRATLESGMPHAEWWCNDWR